ncbi:MAG TPA: hypothetical protein VHK91_05075 [Flavisolibacter sp.]|jgi:hypothetical protein|nr:hypothetical protein [Flavisolibacter sp.]
MKKLSILFLSFLVIIAAQAQNDFKKQLGDARTAYAAGKLDDSRFAMQQMLYELDMITGKEVLKLLPAKMNEQAAVAKLDNVSGASGFTGVIIHREWGKESKYSDTAANHNIEMEVISNSPMIAAVNGLLSLPLIGNTGDNKVVKIAGYKALVTRVDQGDNKYNYDLQLPLNNSLITLKAPGLTQDQVIKLANTIPVQEIAKMLQ